MDYETLNRMQYNTNNNDNIIDCGINNVRTIDDGCCSYEKTADNSSNDERNIEHHGYDESIEKKQTHSITIYRYKFTDEFMGELYKFSKIHQYDHRKDFKESWKTWVDENLVVVRQEVERLSQLGYKGDVIDKMFTSARYYFRKKGTEKKEPKQRCSYIGVQKELLEAMDIHINTSKNKEFKPSDGFEEFCKENLDLLREEIKRLIDCNIKNVDEIKKKIKKTYKNRYFVLITK